MYSTLYCNLLCFQVILLPEMSPQAEHSGPQWRPWRLVGTRVVYSIVFCTMLCIYCAFRCTLRWSTQGCGRTQGDVSVPIPLLEDSVAFYSMNSSIVVCCILLYFQVDPLEEYSGPRSKPRRRVRTRPSSPSSAPPSPWEPFPIARSTPRGSSPSACRRCTPAPPSSHPATATRQHPPVEPQIQAREGLWEATSWIQVDLR